MEPTPLASIQVPKGNSVPAELGIYRDALSVVIQLQVSDVAQSSETRSQIWYDSYTLHLLSGGASHPLFFRWFTQWAGAVKGVWQVSRFPFAPGQSQWLKPAGLL